MIPFLRISETDVHRFLASQAILLSLVGVPGIYVHSLFGSRNCAFCFDETDRPRSLNREKFFRPELEVVLSNPACHQKYVFDGYRHMLRIRRHHVAFHPSGEQQILDINPAVFTVVRMSPDGDELVVCLINVSGERQRVELAPQQVGEQDDGFWLDLLGGERYAGSEIELPGYGMLWLVASR